uniref:Uncharacterized protein n=1 Tax=Cacopsylla melanoneura TaxID=428564 RepID=A0A8D8S846_9HEMI
MTRTCQTVLLLICVCTLSEYECQEHVAENAPTTPGASSTQQVPPITMGYDKDTQEYYGGFRKPLVDYDRMDENAKKQHYRKCNVIVDGIPRRENEDIMQVVELIGRKLGYDYPMNVVTAAHRVRLAIPHKPEPIIIRLRSPGIVEKWIRAYRTKKLWRENWSMNEHLTKENEELMVLAKRWGRENNIRSVFTKNCALYYQPDRKDVPTLIKNREHFNWIMQHYREKELNRTSQLEYTTQGIHSTVGSVAS